MIRPLSALRLTVSVLALLPAMGHAQNYVPANAFSGPNVVIDFAALDQTTAAPNQWGVAPVVQEENLPMPAPAPKLTPPAPKQAMGMAPLAPTPQNPTPSFAPSFAETAQQAHIQPVAPRPAAMPPSAPAPIMNETPIAEAPPALPPRDDFSARDMLDVAPAAPLPVAQKSKEAFNPDNGNIRTRAMLANARNDSKDQHGRVNLASISSAPPPAPRSEAPLQAIDDSANSYKPSVAKPVIAAPMSMELPEPKPVVKPTPAPAPVKKAEPAPKPKKAPEQKIASKPQPESRPAFSDNAPILPPQKDVPMPSARDLNTLDEELPPVMAAADKAPKSDVKPSALEEPMQLASLPLPDSKPAKAVAPGNAGQHFTLNFAKDSGNLDGSAKSELDKIAKALKKDETLRAQVRAYASGTAETSGQARRLSLTRALAARTYVLDQNIPATRLDIRALGNGQGGMDKPTGGSLDKVEITLVK